MDVFLIYLFGLKMALIVTAILILFSNVDDAFVDIYYLCHIIRRKFYIYRRFRRFEPHDLLPSPEQPLVLMIPAWAEANVIGQMLRHTLSSYRYENYHIFVGCYPNDPDTYTAIQDLLPNHNNLHITLMTSPGPTSKADSLNQLYADILRFEQKSEVFFKGYILHDAEDIVHPLELKLYNHLIPRKDMVQIPVIPLERPWHDLTGGHYQDEFAENHIKELVVRESLTGHVPSAGVGTALSRQAMKVISHNHSRRPFDIANLTEDYDLALRLKKHKLKLIFARFNAGSTGIIATREFFPDSIKSVIRQKSRWLIGIAFQGWRNQRWQGSWALKYALFRDRKAIITAQLSVMAYFVIFNIFLVWLWESLFPQGYRYPPLVRKGEFLEYLLWANLFFLLNRVFHRMSFTYQIYGPLSAFLSLPRQLWGNILNFLATLRAIYLYSSHILFDRPLVWDKTDHVFPTEAQLKPFRQKIGELLIDQKLISPDILLEALHIQQQKPRKIGQILLDQGYITEQILCQILEIQENPNADEG